MHFLQAINSDISVLIVCNKTGGTIKGDIEKKLSHSIYTIHLIKKPCIKLANKTFITNLCSGLNVHDTNSKGFVL